MLKAMESAYKVSGTSPSFQGAVCLALNHLLPETAFSSRKPFVFFSDAQPPTREQIAQTGYFLD